MKNTIKALLIGGCLSLLTACDSMSSEDDINQTEQTELHVDGKTLYMDGVINTQTPKQFKKVFQDHPQIDTLIMGNVEGSSDDEANLYIATWIAKKQLTFILQPDSEIASGGTDFFLAGKKRIIYQGAKVGVHAWGEGENNDTVATDFPRGHEEHQPYIDYYMAIGWSRAAAEKFYYFTIESATAEGIHWMSDKELRDFQVTTEKIRMP